MAQFATTAPTAYWYMTRGTGTLALILLTLSVALGVANVRRLQSPTVPRFVLDAVHRNVSLLAVAFVGAHIVTSLLDGFAHIGLLDAFIPFRAVYRPLWLGLGTVAFDLLLAVAITSLVRRSFGYRAWRAVHWLAYASWPVALLHGIGTGSDTKTGWMLVIVGGSVIVVLVAVVARATSGWPEHATARLASIGASALVPLGLLVWLPGGPLAAGWAKKAGTPASLLRAAAGPAITAATARGSATPGTSSPSSSGFTAQASGTVQQGNLGNGLVGVNISLALAGQQLSSLAVDLRGQPIDGGGVQMTSSVVTLGTSSNPSAYRGAVTSLQGTNIAATVSDPSGHSLHLVAQLQIDPGSGSAAGTVTATP